MSFQPVIIGSGFPAWTLLSKSLPTQRDIHAASFPVQSDTSYFLENFNGVNTADDIVSDRRMLRVVLGSYGLGEDIENRFFIKTILNEGASDPSALANKLSDRRYKSLANDFDFSTAPPSHKLQTGLASKTVSRFQMQAFEEDVGTTDNDMRLALTFQRTLEEVAGASGTNTAAWFQTMATPPLREVLQTALGLPREFANLDIDEQNQRLQDKSKSIFGTNDLLELSGAEKSEQIIQRFLIIKQASELVSTNSLNIALLLLGGSQT